MKIEVPRHWVKGRTNPQNHRGDVSLEARGLQRPIECAFMSNWSPTTSRRILFIYFTFLLPTSIVLA